MYTMVRRFFFIFIMLMPLLSNAQFRFGLKVGAGNYDVLSDSIVLKRSNQSEDFILKLAEARIGYFAGIVSQIVLKGFVIQPEVCYQYNLLEMKINGGHFNQTMVQERFHSIFVPIMLGTKAGPLRLNLGPVAYWIVNSSSDLLIEPGYAHDFSYPNFGFQAGLGLDFWKILLDIRYEGNFNRFANHIEFEGTSYSFNDRPKRLMASISFVF
jgi:hypothetical protein